MLFKKMSAKTVIGIFYSSLRPLGIIQVICYPIRNRFLFLVPIAPGLIMLYRHVHFENAK